jgi:charged multivesicular body protein 7
MRGILVLSTLALVAGANGWFWGSSEPELNDLKVHFGLNAFASSNFESMPRTEAEAITKGWTTTNTGDCTNGQTFHGKRYFLKGDYTMGLLYDVNGVIAGIQMILKKDEIAPAAGGFNYAAVPMFQSETLDSKNVYTLTAYFVEPNTICTTGRQATALTSEGTLTQLYFQNGPSIAGPIVAPMTRPTQPSDWSENNCFPMMGWHNFFKVETYQANGCSEVQPTFLLYNEDKNLRGFGFVAFGDATSTRFEKPDAKAIKLIVGSSTPQCLIDKANTVKVSSMHVYFDKKPFLENCIAL